MSALHDVAVPRPDGLDVEVVAKASRRRFTAEYKRKILREADACTAPGAIGALLRRKGLYSSNLTTWRAQRERGELAGLALSTAAHGEPPRVTHGEPAGDVAGSLASGLSGPLLGSCLLLQ